MINIASYFYEGLLLLAFISSLLARRLELPIHLKLFSYLLGLELIVECYAIFLVPHFHIGTNVPIYNIFMLIEFWVYAYYYKMILHSARMQRIIRAYLFLFPVYWIFVVFYIFGLSSWNSYLVIGGGISTLFFSIAFYYQLFTEEEPKKLGRLTEFWIATGLIFYYACDMPYIGMLNFLVSHYIELAKSFLVLHLILNILMYSLFIYAFLCRIPTKKL